MSDGASGGDGTDRDAVDDRRRVGQHRVYGVGVDDATRCAHYDTHRDVVAIRFACCDRYFPCHACHDAVADHAAERVPRDAFDDPAILCGACGTTLTAATYLDAAHACPECGHDFNPGCAAHADRYFDV